MEAAAMTLLDLDYENYPTAASTDKPCGGGAAGTDDDGNHENNGGSGSGAKEASFWNDVLGDDDVAEDAYEGDDAAAVVVPPAASAVNGATPYSAWPAGQWAAVEVNVLGTLTEDLTTAERLVGWRPSEQEEEEEEEEEEAKEKEKEGEKEGEEKDMEEEEKVDVSSAVEILVKWKGRALPHCSWVPLAALARALPLASQRLARFWEKHPKAAGPVVAVPRECVKAAAVLATRRGACDGAGGDGDAREALVKWGGGLVGLYKLNPVDPCLVSTLAPMKWKPGFKVCFQNAPCTATDWAARMPRGSPRLGWRRLPSPAGRRRSRGTRRSSRGGPPRLPPPPPRASPPRAPPRRSTRPCASGTAARVTSCAGTSGGAVQVVDSVYPQLESAWFQSLNL
jgi:hypothetical protein